ncbi:MAG: hypothetical protein ACXWE3_08050, partial [Methylobacter sp.]
EANYLSPEEAEHYNPSCFIVNYPVDFYFRLHQLPAKTFKGLPRKNCALYSLASLRQAAIIKIVNNLSSIEQYKI